MINLGAEFHNISHFIAGDRRKRVPGLPDSLTDHCAKGRAMSRFPEDLRMSLSPQGQGVGLCPAGSEIRFNQVSDKVLLTISCEPAPIVEIYHGSFRARIHYIAAKPYIIEIARADNIEYMRRVSRRHRLPFDPSLTRVILPPTTYTFFQGIKGKVEPPRTGQKPDRRLLMYGSSITQGSAAFLPSSTYAMRTAQLLGYDLINLGCGGSAFCEPEMAEHIAGRDDWDIAVLELGINMISSFSTPEFKRRAEYFVERIRRGSRGKWIFCIDMFTFLGDFDRRRRRAAAYRRVVRELVRKLAHNRLVHLDGRELLTCPAGLTTDLVHPATGGMMEIARRLADEISHRT